MSTASIRSRVAANVHAERRALGLSQAALGEANAHVGDLRAQLEAAHDLAYFTAKGLARGRRQAPQ